MTQADLNALSTFPNDHLSAAGESCRGPEQRREVWNRIQASIKKNLGVERFGIWFKKTELMALRDSTLVVGVPNVIIKQYLEQKYKDSVYDIAKNLTGNDYEVRFDVAPNLFRRARSEHKSPPDSADAGDEEEAAPIHPEGSVAPGNSCGDGRHSFERLILTESNRLPFLAAQEIACKESPRVDFLLIIGRPGYGKTAMLEAIAGGAKNSGIATRGICEMAETWCNEYYHSIQKRNTHRFRNRYRSCDMFLLDGIQFLQGKAGAQDELLFTTKALRAKGARVVLSCSCHPNDLENINPEIHNLLKGAFWAELMLPPKDERVQMARQLADFHRAGITPEVCIYLADAFAGSIRELEAAVSTIATYAALHGRTTMDLAGAHEALSASGRTSARATTIEDICRKTASAAGVTVESLKGPSRSRSICRSRQMAILLARELTELSLSDIGRFFGGRSHSTIKHSYSQARRLEKDSASFADTLREIRAPL